MSELHRAILSPHAKCEMQRRGIAELDARAVLANPMEVLSVRPGRVVAQALAFHGEQPKPYLVRVFGDVDRDPPVVVTAYRTSRINKYRGSP